jgi:hypothetical protein
LRLIRLAGYGGIAGPVLFTAAWVVSSLRQTGYPAAGVQLSGLAAADARDPELMMAAFVVLGSSSIGLGAALNKVAAHSAGPWLVMAAGAATAAAGVFRRDHMLLTGPGFAGQSWHNQVHDVVSGVAYGAMVAAPLMLGRRFRAEADWAAFARPVQVLALASAAAMAVFASGAVEPWNGVVQRAAVTLALTAEILVAARLLTNSRSRAAGTPDHRKSSQRSFSTRRVTSRRSAPRARRTSTIRLTRVMAIPCLIQPGSTNRSSNSKMPSASAQVANPASAPSSSAT